MSTRRPHTNPRPHNEPPSSEAPSLPGGAEAGPPAERLAYSVDEAARLTGLSRDLLYDQMRSGQLRYLKIGRRRLITRQHLEQFLAITPQPASPAQGQDTKSARGAAHDR